MENATIQALELRRPDLRFPFPEGLGQIAGGKRILGLGRRAKFLTMDFDDGHVLVSHLGMSGSYRVERPEGSHAPGEFHFAKGTAKAHDHMVFHLLQNDRPLRVIYNDPRRFGYVQLVERRLFNDHPSFAHLGPEPIGNALTANILAARFAGRKTPIKSALLDQRNIAGLGNIYVCEALWRARISPKRQAGTLVTKSGRARAPLERLIVAIVDVIAEAIEAGGSSLRDHRQTDGTLGYFQHRFSVYDREEHACPRSKCGGTVRRIVQSGRSTFYCPRCQS
jgi:formamidopyrimidine-DNA glycosylase